MDDETIGPVETTPDQRKRLKELLGDWNRIQGRLKRAEQISQLAVVPAINEIRYAGRMLVAALSGLSKDEANGVPSIDDALVSARQYLKNADHDISDALVYYFQDRVDEINRTFGAKSVVDRYPDYQKLLDNLERCRKLVIASRADLSNRDKNYSDIAEVVERIIDEYFILDKADVFMSLEIAKHKRKLTIFQGLSALLALISIALLTILLTR